MKKVKTLIGAIASSFILLSCGMGTPGTSTNTGLGVLNAMGSSNAGAGLGAAAGLLGNAIGGGNTGGALLGAGLNLLGQLIGGGNISTQSIVGTWTYAQPQVTFDSQNILAGIGGELVGNKLSSTLGNQLQKIGLKPGVSKFTFDNQGNVTMTLVGKTTRGTYTLSGNTLTMRGALGLTTLNCTVTINGNQLYMLFDATTIFNVITKLGSSVSTIKSIIGNFNGMKLGWAMTR